MGISLKLYADKWLAGCSHYESYYSIASFTLLSCLRPYVLFSKANFGLSDGRFFVMGDDFNWIYIYKKNSKGGEEGKKNRKRMKKIRTQQSKTIPLRHIMSCCQRQIISLTVTMKATPKVLTQHRASEKVPGWHFENETFIFSCARTHTQQHYDDSDRKRRIWGNFSHSCLYRFVLSQVWSAGLGRGRSSWKIKSCGSQLWVTAGQGNNLRLQIAHDSSRIVSFPKHEFLQLIRWDISLADSILCLAKHSQGLQRLTCLKILYVCLSHPNIKIPQVQ